MTRSSKRCAALVAAALLCGLATAPGVGRGDGVAWAGEEKPIRSVDAADVYVGDVKKWDKPAEVDPDQVYAKIPEYREIVDNGLKPGDARYEILLCKASRRFTCAVKKTARAGGYDLVAKIGCVKGCDSVPNITADVIANL
jgi:hypothetical protein